MDSIIDTVILVGLAVCTVSLSMLGTALAGWILGTFGAKILPDDENPPEST